MKKYPVIKEPDLLPEEFDLFREYIRENGGISLDDSKLDSLRIALLARATIYGFKNYKQYYYFLKFHPEGAEEFKELLTYITIGETCFFRNPAHFAVLRNHILPELIQQRIASGQNYMHIWSAGCSNGDEAYSLAILLTEVLPSPSEWEIEILGTDVSKNALAAATKAVFKKRSLRLLESSYRQKYFSRNHDDYTLREDIKKMVEFRYFNLVKEPYPPAKNLRKWDIIFCCNVMIYFKLETVARVVQNIYDCLEEGGYFFAGYAESLQIIPHKFTVERNKETFYYRKVSQPQEELPARAAPELPFDSDRNRMSLLLPADAQKTAPPLERNLYNEALELYIKEDYGAALEKIKEDLNVHRNHQKALLLLCRIYIEKQMLSEALSIAQQLMALDSLSATVCYILGFIYLQQKDLPHAVEYFKKSIYIERDFALSHYHLAFIYKSLGERGHALREFTNAIHVFERYSPEEPLELSGGFTAKILLQICRKNKNDLLSDQKIAAESEQP